jgi:trimeric autotransporter adhesin
MSKFRIQIIGVAFFTLFTAKAQVGINTTTPNAQLEIKSSDQANPANNDGILIPKVDMFPAINPTIDQDGMMVYLTSDFGANLKGFYYWDNTNSVWKSITGDKGWSLTGNAGTDANTNFIGTTDNVGLKFKVNNLESGHLDPILFNTSFGMKSANNITTGDRNSAIGHQSLFSNTEGYYNSAVGFQSMYYNTTGDDNSSFGALSLISNTSGNRNNAFGVGALSNNSTGNDNVALGYYSMVSNTTGTENVAVGRNSLASNTTGDFNTAIGHLASQNNTTGKDNTSLGHFALENNETGSNNVAIGSGALMNNTASYNVAVGKDALFSNTTGLYNVAAGYQSLYSNISGQSNVSTGYKALFSNTYGHVNVAIGKEALYNNTEGNCNIAISRQALYNNTTGNDNIAIGWESLKSNTSGNYNTATGFQSLKNNTIGTDNSAMGFNSQLNTFNGNNNSSFGSASLAFNYSGNNNCAFGTTSLKNNQYGSANNALGYRALYSNYSGTGNGGFGEEANPTTTTGWNNIGIGYHSLGKIAIDSGGINHARILGNEIGYDNIAFGLVAGDRIGNNCNQSAFIGPFSNVIVDDTNVSNATAIGNGALVFQDNMMRLGNSAITRIETQVGLTVVSDGRYKFNVKEEVKGLDFIKKLRPVVYQYDTEKMDREWMNVEFDTMVKHNPQLLKDYQKASQIRYSGFIAQEVEAASQALNYNFSGISKPEKSDGHYGLDYASFVVPLVKAVQELNETNLKLKNEIELQKAEYENLEKKFQSLENRIMMLEK